MALAPSPHRSSQAVAEARARWNHSPHGRGLAMLSQQQVARVVPELFGRHFLQIGEWDTEQNWLGGSAMLHRCVVAIGPGRTGDVRVEPNALPFAARSIDAVLLPHTLETVGSAHTLLREVSRVLSDRGHLLMVGFNPWGFLAWRRRLGFAPKAFPQDAAFYSAGRVSDWLTLLEFEVVSVRRFGFGFPWAEAREEGSGGRASVSALLSRFTDAYLVHARKRVMPMTWVGRAATPPVRQLVPVPVAGRVTQIRQPLDPDA